MLHSVCNQCNWFSNRRTNVKRCFKQTILSRSPRSYKHRPSPLNSFHLRIRMDPEMIRMDRQLALKRTEQALWPFWIWFGQSNKQVIRMQILWRCSFPVRAYVMNTNIVSFFLYSFIYSLSQSVICLDLYNFIGSSSGRVNKGHTDSVLGLTFVKMMSTSVDVRFLSSSLRSFVILANFAPSNIATADADLSAPKAQNDRNNASITKTIERYDFQGSMKQDLTADYDLSNSTKIDLC